MSRAVVVTLTGILACGLTLTGQTGPGAQAKPESRTPSPFVINEVRFDPSPGDVAYIELQNTGDAPASVVRMAIRIKDGLVMLARVTTPVPPAGRVMVWFDGLGRTEGLALHTGRSLQLDASGGFADLRDERDRQIDAVAWGDADGSVDRHVDGLLADGSQAGRTIGRPPGANRRMNPLDWVVYDAGTATPGADNLMPAVVDLLPTSGEILPGPSIVLSWYPVSGAVEYRVQLAREESFASPLIDSRTKGATLKTGALEAGRYAFRVQALAAGGQSSRFSEPSRIRIIGARSPAQPANDLALRVRTTRGAAPWRSSEQAFGLLPPTRVLPVPYVPQHKDSYMLQLENDRELDPHGWDVNHGAYDASDLSDRWNCVVASAAMINRYFGGDLTQDRIAYEVRGPRGANYAAMINASANRAGLPGSFDAAKVTGQLKERQVGPEWDFIYGDGLNASQMIAALTYATGRLAQVRHFVAHADMWSAISAEIDAGRPLIGKRNQHAVAIIGYGYYGGQRILVANDPIAGQTFRDVDVFPAHQYVFWFVGSNPRAVRQEQQVSLDRDGDGVVDFDETERFHTDPASMDTDKDGVPDKADIASGVFDFQYGYSQRMSWNPLGRDFDRDGVPTELDPDSDSGGCYDGVEDINKNGHLNVPEAWNFNPDDDACKAVNGHLTYSGELTGDIIAGFRTFRHEYFSVSVALKPETPGELGPLIDNGSTFRMSTSFQLEVGPGTECPIFSRGSASGGGRFRPDSDDVGGFVDETEMVVGATGTVPESYSTDMCVMSGDGQQNDSSSLPQCTGKRVSKTSRSYTFSCKTPPEVPPNYTWVSYSMTGSVTLAPPAPGSEAYPGFMTSLFRNPYHQHPEIALPASLSVERIVSGVFAPVR